MSPPKPVQGFRRASQIDMTSVRRVNPQSQSSFSHCSPFSCCVTTPTEA